MWPNDGHSYPWPAACPSSCHTPGLPCRQRPALLGSSKLNGLPFYFGKRRKPKGQSKMKFPQLPTPSTSLDSSPSLSKLPLILEGKCPCLLLSKVYQPLLEGFILPRILLLPILPVLPASSLSPHVTHMVLDTNPSFQILSPIFLSFSGKITISSPQFLFSPKYGFCPSANHRNLLKGP